MWVTQRTWWVAVSCQSFWPTTGALRPPTPTSISSKIRVARWSTRARTALSASATRASSPPLAIRPSGRGGWPAVGLVEVGQDRLDAVAVLALEICHRQESRFDVLDLAGIVLELVEVAAKVAGDLLGFGGQAGKCLAGASKGGVGPACIPAENGGLTEQVNRTALVVEPVEREQRVLGRLAQLLGIAQAL